jgi:hypothetical protein
MLKMTIKEKEISIFCNELQQRQKMHEVQASQPIPLNDAMEVDENILKNVVDVAIANVLEEIHPPAK